ncbi:unnamed protein product [Amoebophrya sp. A25]|nr:unnamed protein product [Amoebophrya sp. A25]|eukprot:GSA25T00002778001.1
MPTLIVPTSPTAAVSSSSATAAKEPSSITASSGGPYDSFLRAPEINKLGLELDGMDMMALLDALADLKREKDLLGIAACFHSIGRLAFKDKSERETLCDFDGITSMCEVLREPQFYHPEAEWTPEETECFRKLQEVDADGGEGAAEAKTEGGEQDDYQEPKGKKLKFTPDSSLDLTYRRMMSAFCLSLKGVCAKSNLNRGALREEGAVEEVVHFVERCFEEITDSTTDRERMLQMCVAAGCSALKSLCAGNDGNKKLAAKIKGKFNAEKLAETDCLDPSVPTMAKSTDKAGKGVDLLLDVLERFPDDSRVQMEAIWALRSIVTDDDARGGESMVPSAVENRDYVCDRERFPRIREIIVRSFRSLKKRIDDGANAASAEIDSDADKEADGEAEGDEESGAGESAKAGPEAADTSSPFTGEQWCWLEGVLLLMKEVGCHQERIHKFVFEDNVLPLIKDTLSFGHESIVRACLFVLRQFAFSDHMKELFTSDDAGITKTAMLVLRKYTQNTGVVEQAFGLFSNLTLRKPQICATLNADPMRIAAMGLLVLQDYQDNASVVTTVLFTLRNVAKAVPEAAKEMEDSGIFELIRKIYFARESSQTRQWLAAKDIGKQFLREFREDTDGMRRPITHNDYY